MSANPITDSLRNRKSVRAFEDRQIPEDIKQEILRCAAQAPTAGNQQLYTILDITDQALKEKLAVTCDNQPFIAKAPLVLIFCADAGKWHDAYIEAGCGPRACTTLVVAGGVGANKHLRARLQQMCAKRGGRACFPRPALCTDNGAMIAFAGALRLAAGQHDDATVRATPRWDMAALAAVGQ